MARNLVPVPATEVKAGDQHSGGPVTAVRTSQSGKTVYITITAPSGRDIELRQPANTNVYIYREQ